MINTQSRSLQKDPSVCVLAACFNEKEVICDFIERVVALPCVHRLVLVDDGSTDSTVEEIINWQKQNNFYRSQNLTSNEY